jgi:hypothetical protein
VYQEIAGSKEKKDLLLRLQKNEYYKPSAITGSAAHAGQQQRRCVPKLSATSRLTTTQTLALGHTPLGLNRRSQVTALSRRGSRLAQNTTLIHIRESNRPRSIPTTTTAAANST